MKKKRFLKRRKKNVRQTNLLCIWSQSFIFGAIVKYRFCIFNMLSFGTPIPHYVYLLTFFGPSPFFLGPSTSFFPATPRCPCLSILLSSECLSICAHSPLKPLSLSKSKLILLGKPFHSILKMTWQYFFCRLWNIMTDCDSCQVVEKVSDSGDTFSYYAQAIGVFLLVLSVVGAWIVFAHFHLCLRICVLCPSHSIQLRL